ncbi:MAG: rubrerythrin family protein, partial [Bacteroidales bacterium]|nr:rubrerythrin family protein [Bacteroidales bacterium]
GIFTETADQEYQHAKRFFSFLEGGMLEITAAYPAGKVGTTMENLIEAANGEREEWEELYPEFANIAEEEGFKDIARVFRIIAKAEITHEDRYRKLIENLEENSVFEKPEKVKWYCRKCGYIHEGTTPPKLCPACLHSQAYYELHNENY